MTAAVLNAPYFDTRIGMPIHTVLPGEHLVLENQNAAIMTLLGSCVTACIRDSKRNAGGLNHFLLPDAGNDGDGASARYGVHAMEVLINALLRNGSIRSDLEAKVFGGGNVLDTASKNPIGDRNAIFVKRFLRDEGIPIAAEDLGGMNARRVIYVPQSGRTRVQIIGGSKAREACQAERAFNSTMARRPAQKSSIELF